MSNANPARGASARLLHLPGVDLHDLGEQVDGVGAPALSACIRKLLRERP